MESKKGLAGGENVQNLTLEAKVVAKMGHLDPIKPTSQH